MASEPQTEAGRALLDDGHSILQHAYSPCKGDCWLGRGILAIEAEAVKPWAFELIHMARFRHDKAHNGGIYKGGDFPCDLCPAVLHTPEARALLDESAE